MDAAPRFPLFPDPTRERVFKKSKDACGVCKQARGVMYDGPAYGESDLSDGPICPWCIADGSAARAGVTFNDSTIYPCFPGTPQMSKADQELVEQRTPGFTTWQGNHWLMCCGRACVYLGEADADDLQGRWAAAVPSMFADLKWSADKIAEFVGGIEQEGSPAAYVFQCQSCGKLQGYWDCD